LLCALFTLALGGCGSDSTKPPREREPVAEPSAQLEEPEGAKLVEVPDVTGMDGQEAVEAIEAEGLYASHDEDDPAGCTVEDQDATGEVEPDTEVILTLECHQRDWEARQGSAWDLFVSSFAWGAQKGCGVLFSFSPTAALYASNREYRQNDCRLATDDDPQSAEVQIPQEAPDDPRALGISLGLVHGCRALFDAEPIHVLSYGNEGFTADDCVGALEVRRAPRRSR
jgi:hypothetical protein